MASVIVTLNIMPVSPDIDIESIKESALQKITQHYGETETKTEVEPIAFGLKAIKVLFVMDESKGSTEELERDISTIEGVNSVEVTDVRRAVG
ncbi:elongation factor 1-beta [Candidatus Woesearchaeota archaeon]|nr:elongation factor 1-beta [Candidatus Woesearchaeota archaeon]